MSGRLLTIDEVCAKLGGVKPWTIRSWVSQRRIPYTKVGRLTRFPEAHIDAWIRANTVEPVAEAIGGALPPAVAWALTNVSNMIHYVRRD